MIELKQSNFRLYFKNDDGILKEIKGVKNISISPPEKKKEKGTKTNYSLQLTGRIERICGNCKHCTRVTQDGQTTYFCTAFIEKEALQVQEHFHCSNNKFKAKKPI